MHGEGCAVDLAAGMYEAKTGVGTHELVITRDHGKSFVDLAKENAAQVLRIFQDRYRAANDGCNVYAVAFLNYGPSVGASIGHPHYQIIAVPFVPPHVARSLRGAEHTTKRAASACGAKYSTRRSRIKKESSRKIVTPLR